MSIEALLDRLATAVEANTQQLQIVEAGRQASLDQILKAQAAAGGEAAPKTRSRKTAAVAEPAAMTAEPETATASVATATTATTAFDDEILRAAVTSYIKAEGLTAEQTTARTENVKAIVAHFGGQLVGPTSKLDDEQKAQALFYVRRYAAGCTVDFGQDYDFAGEPTQGSAAPAAGDDFDIG